MPHIRFTIQIDCDDEPSRTVPAFHGDIFEYEEGSDVETRIGRIDGYLVMRGRCMDEGESLFDAMDSISSSTLECFEALFDPETGEWNRSVDNLHEGDIPVTA